MAKHVHAIKLLNRAIKIYEKEWERIIPIRNQEDCEKIQGLISDLKEAIKMLEGDSNQ